MAPAASPASPARGPALRWVEFLVLYWALPLVYFYGDALPWRPAPIPTILVVLAMVLALLLRDPAFDRRTLWNSAGLRAEWRRSLRNFALLAPLLALYTLLFHREIFLQLPMERPGVWAGIMVFYPVFSVYPQEVLWRVYFFHRFARLFPSPAVLIAANAAAFGFMHLAYGNTVSILLTTLGGLLMARTYHRSRSTLAVCFEHALWGMLVFTLGLGTFFVQGGF
jgi:membrane protease YdiL (CAAX protease family)